MFIYILLSNGWAVRENLVSDFVSFLKILFLDIVEVIEERKL